MNEVYSVGVNFVHGGWINWLAEQVGFWYKERFLWGETVEEEWMVFRSNFVIIYLNVSKVELLNTRLYKKWSLSKMILKVIFSLQRQPF